METGGSVPAWMADAFSGLSGQIEAIAGQAFPVVLTMFGIMIGIKVFKRIGNKI